VAISNRRKPTTADAPYTAPVVSAEGSSLPLSVLVDSHGESAVENNPPRRHPQPRTGDGDAMSERYYLQLAGVSDWIEVSQEKFVQAERAAGFRPKPGCGPVATGGFSNGSVCGREPTKPPPRARLPIMAGERVTEIRFAERRTARGDAS